MKEETVTKKKELTHNERCDRAIEQIKSDKFTISFYCPPMNAPSGGVAVLIRLANELSKKGLNVNMIYEPRLDQRASQEASMKAKKEVRLFERFNPTWLDFDISNLNFVVLGDKPTLKKGEKPPTFSDGTEVNFQTFKVNPEDILIIPEGFPDIMQKTAQISCKRIVLAQSWFYVLNAMEPGQKWQHFGIKDVISVSDAITEYLDAIMPGLNIKRLHQGIDRKTFITPKKVSDKYPMVAFTGSRGPENKLKTLNIIKTFYAFYPQFRWVRFVELKDLERKEFGERLANCAFLLYTDDIAGFGTLPLEAMACGTHVIGWAAHGGKEYMKSDNEATGTLGNGFWTNNGDIFQTAELLGVAMEKWVNGDMDIPEISKTYEETLKDYTVEGESAQIIELINEYKNERINELEQAKTK